jgi:hypothetical protein
MCTILQMNELIGFILFWDNVYNLYSKNVVKIYDYYILLDYS